MYRADVTSPRVGRVADLPTSLGDLVIAQDLVSAGITEAEADRLEYIADQVYFAGSERDERLLRFSVLIVLSTMIAAFGLLADSVAVVIGAMLVAPLMGPILGVAVSLVLTEAVRLAASARTVVGGAAGAVLVGWLISLLASGSITGANLPGEVLGRTSPGLLDLGIAVSAGLAAGYLMVDRKAAASAAGVAIAVALVPPLAVVGICLEVGAWSLAAGALLLFGTNLVAIVLSAAAVIVVMRVLPSGFLQVRFRQLRAGFAAVLLAVVVVSIPLGIHTRNVIEQERFDRAVASAVEDWDPRAALTGLGTAPGDVWLVDLQVSSPASREPAWRLAQIISERTGRPVDLDLSFVTEVEDRAATR
jgi:uncharacterized hydrophobic protein (TIGR00271 family)